MKHDFEQRRQNRIDNARKQAEKNKKLSDQQYNEANRIASFIPPGQPILVGHHSEKRHRADLKRIDNKMRKSIEADKKVKYYEQKAESIESSTAIFSDDPEALQKLRNYLNSLIANQEFMKAANVCLRKSDKEGFMKLKGATEALWQEINKADCFSNRGYARFTLSNNSANIRRVKLRIAQLERFEARPAQEVLFEGGRLVENKEAGRVQLIFDERPAKEICRILGREGFRWSKREGAWQRHLNNSGLHAARRALTRLKEYRDQQ